MNPFLPVTRPNKEFAVSLLTRPSIYNRSQHRDSGRFNNGKAKSKVRREHDVFTVISGEYHDRAFALISAKVLTNNKKAVFL